MTIHHKCRTQHLLNLRRFVLWLANWRQSRESTDTIASQVLMGESIARARAWRAEK